MYKYIQTLMNEYNKSFYPLDMFKFIHHLGYGCRDLKGIKNILEHISINYFGKIQFLRSSGSSL